MATYRVVLSSDAAKGLAAFSPKKQESTRRIITGYLEESPLQHIPGKTKRLRGKLSGFLQYDLSRSDRLIYRIDTKTKTVYVEYIGPHP